MAGDQPDQRTQLDGASVPPPAQPPAGGADINYQPTATAFPAQAGGGADTPAPGAPVGPYDPQAAAGYGYPQPGPAQPAPPQSGYGAPQAGYGQPAPGPNYAYPQPPQQQPQPNYYPGPPTQPPVKQRNPVMVFGAIAGSVLAIGIVIGLIVLFQPNHNPGSTAGSTSGTAGGPGTTTNAPVANALNATWTAPKPTDGGADHRLLGVWTTGKLVIRGDAEALTAYNQSDGQVAWTLPSPSGTKAFCSMSRDANSNNIGAVSFNLGDDDCSAVGAVDATTGKLIFKVGQPQGQSKSFDTQVTVTDTSIAAASGSLLAGFSITDGHQLWSYQPRGQFCNDSADAAGGLVVVSDFCADSSPTQVMQVLNADTGKSTASITLSTENDRISQIVSVKPLVVQVSSDSDSDYLLQIDNSGNAGNKIPLKVTGQDKLQLSSASAAEAKDVVIGNTLYVQVEQNSKPAVEALDLGTGKALWTSDGGAAQGLRLVDKSSVSSPAVIAIDGYDKGARLGNLSTTDGSFTPIASFNKKDLGFMSFSDTEVLMSNDTKSVLAVQGLPIENTVQMFNRK
ncbi:PQQ-binding-like beta-propeller repeat protein [Kitasatospora viridis]|uniref:Putative pyrroloquinoline-quinone binding quinoprotein n=1 Tax=Kitasatospora viridis TaxID=281105 RepID=A0A561UDQ4_9ACTN|nr:PQQ-binding-like beta-propeller repeat protein [Kitasatospora viridis]TWF97465.1 putative pyrroloquinoline-quinone binding quinoprotein [Kitasatospora viridis]